MMVRSTDPDLDDRFNTILDHVVRGDKSHYRQLVDMSAEQVVDAFWPAADGWTTVAVEPGVEYVTWVLTHPMQGVAACMLSTLDTREQEDRRVAHPDDWDRLNLSRKSQNVDFIRHLHGPNPAAAVLQFWRILAERWLLFGEHELLNRAVEVPAFLYGPARTMHALGAFDALLSIGATERGRDRSLLHAALARIAG